MITCVLQFTGSTDAVIFFGDNGILTVKEYIWFLLERYQGKLKEHIWSDNSGLTVILEFPALINAQSFFYEFKTKITPRMFTDDGNFECFNDEKLDTAFQTDFAEESYYRSSIILDNESIEMRRNSI